jgi:hypothetical protein
MDNYKELNEYLMKGRNKNDRPVENNTRVVRINEKTIGIKLHDTFIVTHYVNNHVKLNSNGWRTVTTRDRMNKYTESTINIYQSNFIWYVDYYNQTYLFEDNMVFLKGNKNNNYENYVTDKNANRIKPMTTAQDKKIKALKKKVDVYCKTFIDKLIKQEIHKPSEGDCWYCLLRDQNGQSMGDAFNDKQHILSHIEERYYVPSMIKNAMQECEISNYYLLSEWDKHNIAWCMRLDGWETTKTFNIGMTKKRMVIVLKRYIRKRLGLGIT